jgi:hypothetical protein
MAKTEQSKQEAETIIRWDETDEPAILWTGSVATRNEWKSWGYSILETKDGRSWRVEVPKDRVSFKPLKK